MTRKYETTIANCQVELEIYEGDGDCGGCCDVTSVSPNGRTYFASLACLEDTGVLTSCEERNLQIDPVVIDQITAWAAKHGY